MGGEGSKWILYAFGPVLQSDPQGLLVHASDGGRGILKRASAVPAQTWRKTSFATLGYISLPILLALHFIGAPPDNRTYGPSHWFLSYQHGFLRRALIGQAFSHIQFLPWRSIFLIEGVVLLFAIGLTYLIFRSILFGSLDEARLGAFLLAAPAFIPHMAIMDGELDNFLYIAVISAAWSLMRLGGRAGIAAASVFVCLGLAVHEGFILLFYPLILGLLMESVHRRKIKLSWAATHLAVVGVCFITIISFGKFRANPSEWIAQAQLRTDMPIEGTVVMAIHNTFTEQVRFVLQRYTPSLIKRILLTLILSIPYGVVLWRLLYRTVRARGYGSKVNLLVILTFAMPLLLIPLGHDAMRWLSALCINVSLYVLFLYQADRVDPEKSAFARNELSLWNLNSANTVTFIYLVSIGPWGLAGNRFLSNVNTLFGK